ncbi:unnamed protein product [Ixodes persulcatus]
MIIVNLRARNVAKLNRSAINGQVPRGIWQTATFERHGRCVKLQNATISSAKHKNQVTRVVYLAALRALNRPPWQVLSTRLCTKVMCDEGAVVRLFSAAISHSCVCV